MKMELFFFGGHMICSILLVVTVVVSVRGQESFGDDTEDSNDDDGDIGFGSGDRSTSIVEDSTKKWSEPGSKTTLIIDAKTAVNNFNNDAAPVINDKDALTFESGNSTTLVIAFVACAVAIIAIVASVAVIMIRRKQKQTIILSPDAVKKPDLEIGQKESVNIYEKAPYTKK